ncbi:hypothetical protein NUSPORA_00836 [Nucleospora cyclopteri]
MTQINTDTPTSELKREGMKYITNSVYNILKENKQCTYQEIVKAIETKNRETKARRIYDVLNVLRAVNIVGKTGKTYFIINSEDSLDKKKEERDKLKNMKECFKFITLRNTNLQRTANKVYQVEDDEKLFLPFMLVYTERNSEVHCDTNEERNYFNLRCNQPLKILEDLDVLKIMKTNQKENNRNTFLEDFLF